MTSFLRSLNPYSRDDDNECSNASVADDDMFWTDDDNDNKAHRHSRQTHDGKRREEQTWFDYHAASCLQFKSLTATPGQVLKNHYEQHTAEDDDDGIAGMRNGPGCPDRPPVEDCFVLRSVNEKNKRDSTDSDNQMDVVQAVAKAVRNRLKTASDNNDKKAGKKNSWSFVSTLWRYLGTAYHDTEEEDEAENDYDDDNMMLEEDAMVLAEKQLVGFQDPVVSILLAADLTLVIRDIVANEVEQTETPVVILAKNFSSWLGQQITARSAIAQSALTKAEKQEESFEQSNTGVDNKLPHQPQQIHQVLREISEQHLDLLLQVLCELECATVHCPQGSMENKAAAWLVLGTGFTESQRESAVALERIQQTIVSTESQLDQWKERRQSLMLQAKRQSDAKLRRTLKQVTFLDSHIAAGEGRLTNLEQTRHALETSLSTKDTLTALKESTHLWKDIQSEISVEEVDNVVLDLRDEMDHVQEIGQALNGGTSSRYNDKEEEELLLAELKSLAISSTTSSDQHVAAETGKETDRKNTTSSLSALDDTTTDAPALSAITDDKDTTTEKKISATEEIRSSSPKGADEVVALKPEAATES